MLVALDLPNRTEYARQVEQQFFEGAIEEQDWLERCFALAQARRRIGEIVRRKPSGRLLEVGVGTGELLYVAGQRGFDGQGIESSRILAEAAYRRSGIPILVGRVEDLRPEGHFDVVVMSHVLEHLPEPIEVLGHLRASMSPGAILYVAVPNIDSWEARLPGWTSYQPYHLFYFSQATLRRAVEAAGFDMVEAFTFEPFSGWLNAVVRTAFRRSYFRRRRGPHAPLLPRPGGTGLRVVLNLARVAIGVLTGPLRWMQAGLGRGEEIVAIATPRK